jgi:phage shock protein A
MELLLLRLVVWVGVPLFLLALALGPARCWRSVCAAWAWLGERRQEPTEVLTRVVKEHEKNIKSLREVLHQAEGTQSEIVRNMRRSEENIGQLQQEARYMARQGDDLGARAALYKLNLEQVAVKGFQEQLEQQKNRVDQARRRLHLLELQLRQYEVGRSILLSQLADAKTVEQQYALASQFDPFSAVAAWVRAEGTVQQAAETAAAVEKVYNDTADLPLTGLPLRIEPEVLDAQLAELKAQMNRPNGDR